MLGHVRHVEAVAFDIEFPAVIGAANAFLLVAAEEQRGAAMRAAMIEDADTAQAVANRDQFFAEQHQPQRRAIGLEFG